MLNVEGQATCKQQLFGAFPDFQFSLSVVSDSLRPQRSLTLESDKGAEGFESRLFIHIYNFGGGRSGGGLSTLLETVLPPGSDVCVRDSPGSATASTLRGRLSKPCDPSALGPLPPPPRRSVLPLRKMMRQHYTTMGENLPVPT